MHAQRHEKLRVCCPGSRETQKARTGRRWAAARLYGRVHIGATTPQVCKFGEKKKAGRAKKRISSLGIETAAQASRQLGQRVQGVQ